MSFAPEKNIPDRGRRIVRLDLKASADMATALAPDERADMLIEGFRPGVMERLGFGTGALPGPESRDWSSGRMTGWGQTGHWQTAGHDINYLALSGALHAIGLRGTAGRRHAESDRRLWRWCHAAARRSAAALLEAGKSGQGQVVDAAMSDGSALRWLRHLQPEGDGILERSAGKQFF